MAGILDSLLSSLGKTVTAEAAIKASKTEDGSIDPAKAAGIAMGLGCSSPNDLALLGAMLEEEGAFDRDR